MRFSLSLSLSNLRDLTLNIRYGLNQQWQSTLLDASRALRHNSLRGRIWTSPYTAGGDQDNENENDDGEDSASSMSSSGSHTGMYHGHRQRPRFQSTGGRVKGMVASFERHDSLSSSSSRSISPTKPSHSSNGRGSTTGRRSASPFKSVHYTVNDGDPDELDVLVKQEQEHDITLIRLRPRPQSDTFLPSSSRVVRLIFTHHCHHSLCNNNDSHNQSPSVRYQINFMRGIPAVKLWNT